MSGYFIIFFRIEKVLIVNGFIMITVIKTPDEQKRNYIGLKDRRFLQVIGHSEDDPHKVTKVA